jgi:hypothetical protein
MNKVKKGDFRTNKQERNNEVYNGVPIYKPNVDYSSNSDLNTNSAPMFRPLSGSSIPLPMSYSLSQPIPDPVINATREPNLDLSSNPMTRPNPKSVFNHWSTPIKHNASHQTFLPMSKLVTRLISNLDSKPTLDSFYKENAKTWSSPEYYCPTVNNLMKSWPDFSKEVCSTGLNFHSVSEPTLSLDLPLIENGRIGSEKEKKSLYEVSSSTLDYDTSSWIPVGSKSTSDSYSYYDSDSRHYTDSDYDNFTDSDSYLSYKNMNIKR